MKPKLRNNILSAIAVSNTAAALVSCSSNTISGTGGAGPGGIVQHGTHEGNDERRPHVPEPDPAQAKVPVGYKIEVFLKDLTYPTSAEFDDQGNFYVAEAGYSYGDPEAQPRILRISSAGSKETVTTSLNGPVNDLLWHKGKLYISHRGKISVLEGSAVHDLITGLPSEGDHHNNQMAVGPNGKIYFGQGTASNSGVIGLDNDKMGWLKKHPQFHDIPAKEIELREEQFTTANPLKPGSQRVQTAAFHPFGEVGPESNRVAGQTKASGTILRMNADGSELEVYAWGLRNPYGLACDQDGKLYASENGFDDRGSRPIANDKEDLYEIKEGAWYGWPDFASGIPVTDPRFKPEHGPAPQFLMANHPPVEKPLLTFSKHSAATKMAFAQGDAFGRKGKLFLAFFGHMSPMTGKVEEHGGHRVVAIDLATMRQEVFLSKQDHHGGKDEAGAQQKDAHEGHSGSEHKGQKEESITAGPRRLVDVVFSPKGDALYVVDFGSLVVTTEAMPIRKTGVIWRITRDGSHAQNEHHPQKNGFSRLTPTDSDETIKNKAFYAFE
jgi:glucose/arabinose dehydrogenase